MEQALRSPGAADLVDATPRPGRRDGDVDDRPDVPVVAPAGAAGPGHSRLRRALRGEPGVAALALLAGAVAWWFADRRGLPLLYADARSHLTISRRLLDGPNHGIVQLGTVWLPLPHLVVTPFTMVTRWWMSGAAVLPVNLVCLVIEAVALFRVVFDAGRSRVGAWIAVVVLLANPGWLYLHTTALGEPVLFAAILLTVAALGRWIRSDKPYSGGELAVFCGLPAAAAVLSRYDGWAMAAAAGLFVLLVARARWGHWRYAITCTLAFAVPSTVAAAWWFWFNFVHWGDPLEFQRGRYSAQAQQDILDRAGLLPDKGDLARSVRTFLTATIEGAGVWVVVTAAVGAAVWLVVGRLRLRALPPWLLVVVPVGFYVLSLYTGQIALRLGDHPGSSMFNLRYGLQVLPGLAAMCGLGIGVLAGHGAGSLAVVRRAAAVAVAAAVVMATAAAWVPSWQQVPVIAEGLQQRELGESAWAGAEFLRDEAIDGSILIDDSVNPMLPVIGADLDRVVAPFSGPEWERALDDPGRVQWIYADSAGDGDAVDRAIRRDRRFAAAFEQVFSDGTIRVFRRRSPT
jgi:hypothetical protein